MTGDMMKSVSTSASPARSWFGGTFVRPSAWRVRDKTMIMRVKLVSSISNEGATASSVKAMIIVMLSLGWLTVPPRFTEIVPPEPELDVPLGVTGDCGASGEVAVTAPPEAVPPPDPSL
jgi:hypothetical protein